MFHSALIATDLSQASSHVLECLSGLRSLGTRQVILCHALNIKHLEEMQHLLTPYVEPRLAAQRAIVEAQGFETSTVIAPGLAVFEVNRVAKERGVSLIVVGSHGSTLAKEMLLGGTATGILHHADLPVFVIRVTIMEKDGRSRCETACEDFRRHVLFCTDFSDTAERAFLYVEKIAESGAKRVTLLHVQDQTRIEKHLKHRLDEFNEIDRDRLERLKMRLEQNGASEVQIELPYGSPIQEIIRCAKQKDETLIVMGSQGRGFIQEVFLGSVSHQVVRAAPVPVLLVPALR
ncbi:MAG: universal stress protein [Pirellulales bacterium]